MENSRFVEENQLPKASKSLDDLLDDIHEENLHPEIDTGPSVGKEEC